jgi:ABC-type proline/glycine betaine transport system substrate-binding protein
MQTAENYQQTLASGDPGAIARAISPATQQINQQSEQTKERINQDSARGGAKNLALAENEINKGAQIGNTATQSFLQSFNSLAGLAGQGVGQSQGSMGQASSALGAAGSQYSQVANQQAEEKATQLGFMSSLAGSGAQLAGMCWIAEVLYSRFSYKTYLLRHYFDVNLRGHWLGKYVTRAYEKYGEWWAPRIEHYSALYIVARCVFDRLVKRAMHTISERDRAALYEQYRRLIRWEPSNA